LFIADAVNVAVVRAAQWYRELITYLNAHGLWLREAQMMRITGPAAADETGLASHKFATLRITQAYRLWRNGTLADGASAFYARW
jgi:hypothetical protein